MTVAPPAEVHDQRTSPAARWTPTARLAAAGTLLLGPGLQLAAIVIQPEHDRVVDTVAWIAEHPGRANLGAILFLLAMPFWLASALVYVLLARRRSPRLAYAGGILLGCGLTGLAAVSGYETLALALAQRADIDPLALADALESMSSPPEIAMLLVFVPFAFFGLLVTAMALWRSAAVPVGSAVLLAAFVVVDFFLNEGFGIVSSGVAHAIAFLAAAWIAWSVLLAGRQRRPSSEGARTVAA